jgi:hypothetical protein
LLSLALYNSQQQGQFLLPNILKLVLSLVAQGLDMNYFHPSTDTSKKNTREEGISHVKFSYPTFQNSFILVS